MQNNFMAKLQQAQKAQRENRANTNLREFVDQSLLITGMSIVSNVELTKANLVMDKVVYTLKDGSAVDSFHKAAVENAKIIIEMLGEGPWPVALIGRVESTLTARGEVYYVNVIGSEDVPEDMDIASTYPDEDPVPDLPQSPEGTDGDDLLPDQGK